MIHFSVHARRLAAAALLASVCTSGATAEVIGLADKPASSETLAGLPDQAFEVFLDRLMGAESGGRDLAANPRSTALGPYQFIKSTFLELARRHFPAETGELGDEQVLALRTNRHFARRAAGIYSKENADHLADQGLKPNYAHLRLAFLVGPYAAARLMQAQPTTPVSQILGPAVIRANPFMTTMRATDLIAKAARDVSGERLPAKDLTPRPYVRSAASAPDARPRPDAGGSAATAKAAPSFKVTCNQQLVSCRRWVAMQHNKLVQQSKLKTRNAEESRGPAKGERRNKI